MYDMTDSEWDIDVPEESSEPTGPKALRDAYERQKAEAAQLKKDLQALNAKVRNQEIQSKLSSKGVPEKAWGLFPRDIDPTDEKVTEWVEEYGSLFGSPSKEEPVNDAPAAQEAPQVDQDQLRQIQQVTSGGAGGSTKEDFEAMLANPNLENEVPFEKFLQALASQGAKIHK